MGARVPGETHPYFKDMLDALQNITDLFKELFYDIFLNICSTHGTGCYEKMCTFLWDWKIKSYILSER